MLSLCRIIAPVWLARKMGPMFPSQYPYTPRLYTARMGPREAVRRLHAKGLRLYATFVFGYDHDTLADFETTRRFCEDEGIFMVAFNHLTPFPGTPLYDRLLRDDRILEPAFRFPKIDAAFEPWSAWKTRQNQQHGLRIPRFGVETGGPHRQRAAGGLDQTVTQRYRRPKSDL